MNKNQSLRLKLMFILIGRFELFNRRGADEMLNFSTKPLSIDQSDAEKRGETLFISIVVRVKYDKFFLKLFKINNVSPLLFCIALVDSSRVDAEIEYFTSAISGKNFKSND